MCIYVYVHIYYTIKEEFVLQEHSRAEEVGWDKCLFSSGSHIKDRKPYKEVQL